MNMPQNVPQQIKAEIEKILGERGIELVEFKIFFSGGTQTVRCLIDYPCGGINIDECSRINKEIFAFIEQKGFFGDNLSVEVNSPSIDRPLKAKNDFARLKEKNVMLWLTEPLDQKSYYEGKIRDINDLGIILAAAGKTLEISFDRIKIGKEKI